MLTVEHQQIDLRRLPKALEGFRIVQLSDVHHGPFSSKAQIERAVETAVEGMDSRPTATLPTDLPAGWAGRMCRSLEHHPLVGWAAD